jgi:hypothetical protein
LNDDPGAIITFPDEAFQLDFFFLSSSISHLLKGVYTGKEALC